MRQLFPRCLTCVYRRYGNAGLRPGSLVRILSPARCRSHSPSGGTSYASPHPIAFLSQPHPRRPSLAAWTKPPKNPEESNPIQVNPTQNLSWGRSPRSGQVKVGQTLFPNRSAGLRPGPFPHLLSNAPGLESGIPVHGRKCFGLSFFAQVLALICAVTLGTASATAQTIFNENFDGGYAGSFGTGSYSGGNPTAAANAVLSSGGNPNGCWQETMTPTNTSAYYVGQVQLMQVPGIVDPNPANYVLSFDAYGSHAAPFQLIIQTWPNNYFGGTGPVINSATNCQLSAANTWQTFHINLGNLTTATAAANTWQLEFQLNASQWGGAGQVDTLKVDNLTLVHLANSSLQSSANPSFFGDSITFTLAVQTNGVTAGNATGTVVFALAGLPFSTNAVSNGTATSLAVANLPIGTDLVTAVYSGGNYPGSTNTAYQIVNPPSGVAAASDNLPLYTDNLVNGFQFWGWATVNLATNSPTHSGVYAMSVQDAGNQAVHLEHPNFNTAPYTSFSFWANGGSTGGQHLQVDGLLNEVNQTPYHIPAALAANTWQQITVPLSALGVSNKPNCTGFEIQGTTGLAQPIFYLDDVQLNAAPPPGVVHLSVDAGNMLQTVDARQFGLNTATWDGVLGNAATLSLLQNAGTLALRWPGGSTSDGYHWQSDPAGNATFRNVATNLGAQVFTTVNYGTGTAAEAAAWVLAANKTNNCGFKYWEVGNECYGSWETDSNAVQHDPFTYANQAAGYIQQMKAAYPSVPIKVGVVVVPGENTYVNNTNHFAVNSRTTATNYGWTPIVLSRLKTLGVYPDFLIYHFYFQYTASGWSYYSASPESDALLLQVAGNPSPSNWSDWASAAANLRQQITDYLAPGTNNVELCVTENNSDAGAMGRESTSLVNALYLADSTSELMKTEFRSYLWWDLHNGSDTSGDFDPRIYGWRTVGDYGISDRSDNPYPTFYAEKLMQYFARPGDAVLNGTSDNLLLSAYATHRANGTLTMLVINKALTMSLNAQIALTNFMPWSSATTISYGIPQDQAASTNAAYSLQDLATNNFTITGTNFSCTFPPLSLTLFAFAPSPAVLSGAGVQSGKFKLTLQGQPGTPYVVQSSMDMKNWTSLSTNILIGNTVNITNSVTPGLASQFYRAIWEP